MSLGCMRVQPGATLLLHLQGSAADLIKRAMTRWDAYACSASASSTNSSPAATQQSGAAPGSSPQPTPGTGAALATPPHAQPPPVRVRLLAQIHDELLFEVDSPDARLAPDGELLHPGQSLLTAAAAVRGVMEGAAPLAVPLRCRLSYGRSWGAMTEMD